MEFLAKTDGIHCNGKRLNIRGTNWFGCETPDHVFHGLWQVSWKSLMDVMVSEGYNLVRVPLSIQMMEDMDTLTPKTINYSVNPDLKDKTAGAILDMMFTEFSRRGILILPDVHRNHSTDGISELWFDDATGYTETRLINAWVKFLKRYRDNPFVFAADLRNEPHGKCTWKEWAAACERMGNAILREFPEKLIFCAGVEHRAKPSPFGAYWGSVLDSVRERPVVLSVPDRVVYTPHYYGPSVYPMQYHSDIATNVPKVMEQDFGYICREGLGCVFLGEIGGRAVGKDEEFHEAATKYIEGNPGLLGSFAMWSLCVNSGDTGSFLKDDWKTVDEHKQKFYRRMGPNPTKLTSGAPVPPKPEPVPAKPVPAPKPPKASTVKLTVAKKESWADAGNVMTKYELDVFNGGTGDALPVVSLTGGLGINTWSCAPQPMTSQGIQKFSLPVWQKSLKAGERWTWGCIVSSRTADGPVFKLV
jgi:endoglucanase